MKQYKSASSRWLVVASIAAVYAIVVSGVKKLSSSEPAPAPAPHAAPAAHKSTAPSHKRKRPEHSAPPAAPAEAPPAAPAAAAAVEAPAAAPVEDPLAAWRVRSNAVWSLCEAAAVGDMQTLRARLNEQENVNARDELGNTPLHLAAAAGQVEPLQALLQAGADPLAVNKKGLSPAQVAADEATRAACQAGELPRRKQLELFDAVKAGRVEQVRRALQDGVNPNALSADSESSLLTAAVMAGQVEISRLLLEAGANVLYVQPNSRCALNLAAGGGKVELVKLLLSHGADPMMHTNHGAYPIHDAIWSGRTEAALLLIPYYKDINYSPNGRGNGYPISMAIGRGNRRVVQAFLDAGLNPNDPIFAKEPLLVQAAKRNDAELVRMLLNAHADKQAKDAQGKRAIDYASGDLAELLK